MKKSLLTLYLICLSVILLTPTGVMAGKPTPPPPPLMLYDVNIVTAEPDGDGRLRVWGYTGGDPPYKNIWSAESVHYDSVAIGDADNDKITREIVGTTRRSYRKGSSTWYEIFFAVYKQGESGVWKSSPGVREDRVYWENEITIADVDGDSCNEVVMKTPHWLVVYEYDGSQFYISASQSINGCGVQSLTVKNIDGNPGDEILISVNPTYVTDPYPNQGYIYVYSYTPGQLTELANIYRTDLRFCVGLGSLRVGDIDGDGNPEIITSARTVTPGYVYQYYLVAWKWPALSLLVKQSIGVIDVHLDVGELDNTHPGDEIAVVARESTANFRSELDIYEWESSSSTLVLKYDPIYRDGWMEFVIVADSNVIVAGTGVGSQKLSLPLYLGVFSPTLTPEWEITSQESYTDVWYAAVG